MREKFFLIMLITVFITAFSYSQKITITTPHSGSKWYKGYKYTIKWTKSGTMNPKVKIRLYQGKTKVLGITDTTDNDGSFSWTIPTNLSNGTYYIRVKTIDNKVFNDSKIITIINIKSTITFISPHKGSVWLTGKQYTISWKTTGIDSSELLNINLYINSININNLKAKFQTYNNGNLKFHVPSSYKPGTYYIRINKPFSSVYADSQPFQIQRMMNYNKIKVFDTKDLVNLAFNKIEIVAPKTGNIISPEKDVWIIWKNLGTTFKYVTIILYKPDGSRTPIAYRISNTGKFLWRLSSSGIKPSDQPYKIGISAADSWGEDYKKNHVSNKTGYFYIK